MGTLMPGRGTPPFGSATSRPGSGPARNELGRRAGVAVKFLLAAFLSLLAVASFGLLLSKVATSSADDTARSPAARERTAIGTATAAPDALDQRIATGSPASPPVSSVGTLAGGSPSPPASTSARRTPSGIAVRTPSVGGRSPASTVLTVVTTSPPPVTGELDPARLQQSGLTTSGTLTSVGLGAVVTVTNVNDDSASNALLRAVGAGTSRVRLVWQPAARAWAIQAENGLFWKAETTYADDGYAELRAVADSSSLSSASFFVIERFATGDLALRLVANNRYVVVERPDGTRFQGRYFHLLRGVATSATPDTLFRLG